MIEIDLENSLKGVALSKADNFGRLLMDVIGACTAKERLALRKSYPEEVETWEKVQRTKVFDRLRMMIPKADPANLEGLRKAFPEQVKAWEEWFHNPSQDKNVWVCE